jgi:hypothetical protein
VAIAEQVDARRNRIGPTEALRLARSVRRVIVAKGKHVDYFEIAGEKFDRVELLSAMLGPNGTLRAPAVRVGHMLLVGFDDDSYAAAFK